MHFYFKVEAVFHTFLTVACLYVLVRCVYPLKISTFARLLIAIGVLIVSKYHYWSLLIYGDMWSPELPFGVVLVLGWLFCAFVLLTVFTVIGDVAGLALTVSGRRPVFRRIAPRWRAGSVLLALALAAVGVQQAIKVPDVRRVELAIDNLPPEFNGFRFVQLSDLHISRLFPESWARAVVDRTNELSPDLVLISGDLIDGYTDARRSDVTPLADLQARYGVIGIPGNHEYYFDYSAWAPVFKGMGIKMLENQHVVLQQGNAALTIAGITDDVAPKYGFAGPDLARALAGAPASAPTILLSHRPEAAMENADAGIDVQLSGHTHGGMILGFDQVVARANEGYVSRGYDVGRMKLYVSNGTGLWMGFPVRLGVPSEITEFVLRPAN
ncbi:metallophosphoesterase [Pseudomonas capsici]|uniref:metallophosphoesterase n=1 Tax=Pseudomonas capsici TaxID=2810614 RepID=UPI0021F0DBE6|nr:metallophosphoesterase [Pseudomonas capsici]